MELVERCDVLVVGGGPVGVALGLLLGKEGGRTVIAEREPGLHLVAAVAQVGDDPAAHQHGRRQRVADDHP